MKSLEGYSDRFVTSKNWERVAFRASGNRPIYLQQAELNEVQSINEDRIKGIADALLKDGDVVADATISVDGVTGLVSALAGLIYVSGRVRTVPASTFTIPIKGVVVVGVRLIESISTELDDPELYGQVTGAASYQQPGAARLVVTPSWGSTVDGITDGEFYPVYTITDGQLHTNEPPPDIDSIRQAIARYDIDSAGGTYVVSGFDARQLDDLPSGDQVYSIAAGRARVMGFAVELQTATRVVYPATPDVRTVDAEPFASAGTDAQRINVARTPIAQIRQVRIVAQKTVNILHGSYSGVVDALPDTSVVAVPSVVQAGKTYKAGTDYKLTNGQIDWSLPGDEPSPGSTYQVTYQFYTIVAPTNPDASGFTVSGAVAGSLILTTYDVQLPRYDRLCLDKNGILQWVKGIAADFSPRPPTVPDQLLPLVSVYQTWDGNRATISDGVRMVPMATIRGFESKLDYLTQLIAEQELKADATIRDSSFKKGLFVDSLIDESGRDAGVAQTLAISGGELVLPIAATLSRLPNDVGAPTTLAFTKAAVVSQLLKTSTMSVNPYMSAGIPPATATITPAVDSWEEVQSSYASFITQYFTATLDGSFHNPEMPLLNHPSYTETTVSTKTLAQSSTAISTLRQIPIAFSIKGFGAGERLSGLTFDGVGVVPTPSAISADASGNLSGVFSIPANIPAGSKAVVFRGAEGTVATAAFTGGGTLTLRTLQQITSVTQVFYDPLAQSFALTSGEQIVGIDVSFGAKGATDATLMLRGVDAGVPNTTIYGQSRKAASDIVVSGDFTSFDFAAPVMVDANMLRAFSIMCGDTDLSAHVAQLGKFDPASGWVTSQPYNIGDCFSGSNNVSWVVHPDRDIRFRVNAARYTETKKSISLGSVAVTNATDLIVQAAVDTPDAATFVVFTLGMPDGSTVNIAPNQPLALSAAVTGNISVTATLNGTATRSPILYPGVTLIAGTQAGTGNYAGRSYPAGPSSKAVIIYDALIPSGSAVAASIKGASGEVAAALTKSVALDDGYREYTHTVPSTNETVIGVKLVETGTPAARPHVRNIRSYTVAA